MNGSRARSDSRCPVFREPVGGPALTIPEPAVTGSDPPFPPDWTLQHFAEVDSTNLVAAALPSWHAVRADTQTAGRGRFQRAWVSDAGGLWLSAVVPVVTNSPTWRLLPLVAGLAICETLRQTGAHPLRLRWPNDVLVGDRKLAGLLIDQFRPGLAVVGIGINVRNRPETQERLLQGQVARLADLVPQAPSLHALAVRVLAALKSNWLDVQQDGPETVLARINALWDLPRRVRLDLDGPKVSGDFLGVDASGRLQLTPEGGPTQFFEPQDVKLLRDLGSEPS